MGASSTGPWRDRVDEVGRDVADRAQELVAQGQKRRVIVRDAGGKPVVRLPLLVGLAVGLATLFTAPWLLIIGVVVGALAKLRLAVVRDEPPLLPPG